MPVGRLTEYEKELTIKTRHLSYSEYIVFDPSQIRIRYVVQVNRIFFFFDSLINIFLPSPPYSWILQSIDLKERDVS